MQPDDPASILILALAKNLGVPPVSVTLYLPLLILAANRIARLIPDDATGWRKYLRVGLSIIGVKVANRETSGTRERSEVGADLRDSQIEAAYRARVEPEPEQGALVLDMPEREMQIPQMFRSGASRMNSTQKED